MSEDKQSDSGSVRDLVSLTEYLHLSIPEEDMYLLHGGEGTFVINTNKKSIEEQILEE